MFVMWAGPRMAVSAWSQTAPAQNETKPATPPSGAPAPAPPAEDKPAPQAQDKNDKDTNDQGVFVFRKDVDEVLLHASVVDDKQHIITTLDRSAFTVFEDGKPQNIISFHQVDIPVAMGIIIDNSGSMREKRAKVNQAALNLVRSSNPKDEVFIVNFNDEYYLDQDFTNNLLKLKEALEKIDARGGTALYDAVVASADHLKRNARLEKKVLFIVTDGEDNASNETLEQAVKHLQEENGPSVYAIGILGDEEHPKRANKIRTRTIRVSSSSAKTWMKFCCMPRWSMTSNTSSLRSTAARSRCLRMGSRRTSSHSIKWTFRWQWASSSTTRGRCGKSAPR